MPRKEFESFTRLDASSINTFLMDQSVQSFADSTARASAITTPVEGMVTYLNDIDSLSVYNGSDWTTDRTIQVFAGTAARGSAIPSPVEGMYTHINETDSLEYYDGSAWEGVGGGGGGAILQVVSNTKTNIFVSSSIASAGTVAITDLEVTITPSSIDSKILIQASIFGDTVSSDIAYILLKNGSDLTAATGDADGVRKRITSAALNRATTPILFLDSPASTSPLTYSISAFNRSVNANVLYVNRSASTDNIASQIRGISTITAMEVIA